jgi:tRNA A37 threonylcarbamoyladenosine synthetase subunit TsaC/SUA5/YrdC
MRINVGLVGAYILGLALPAAAQSTTTTTTTTYYVVQDVKTKKCTIIDEKPAATEYTVVGDEGTVYKTRAEAENIMKSVKVCTIE